MRPMNSGPSSVRQSAHNIGHCKTSRYGVDKNTMTPNAAWAWEFPNSLFYRKVFMLYCRDASCKAFNIGRRDATNPGLPLNPVRLSECPERAGSTTSMLLRTEGEIACGDSR